MLRPFRDRAEAGRRLAEKLVAYAGRPDVLVLALPRGGVPVAFEVAQALGAPLDVFVVRKLGVPGHEELAMGAIASGGVWVLNEDVIERLKPPFRLIQDVAARELQELKRTERLYRGDRPSLEVRGRDGDPGGRRARDRFDDAGRRGRFAAARAGSPHRGRSDCGARRPAPSSATRSTNASA